MIGEISRLRIAIAGTAIAVVYSTASAAPVQKQLPPGFIYLADVEPTIVQDIRYAASYNFVGRRISGYEAAACILTASAARALTQVQAELRKRNLSLLVWDCYRPSRAVADFVMWSKVPHDTRMKTEFYPRTDKARFFELGYLASRSAHSRGSTVDLGIVQADVTRAPRFDPAAPMKPCTAPKGTRFEDGTIDLGTGYDCLDVLASTNHREVGKQALENRLLLRDLMVRSGFKPYGREWWHFELVNEPFPGRIWDFPIVPRPPKPAN